MAEVRDRALVPTDAEWQLIVHACHQLRINDPANPVLRALQPLLRRYADYARSPSVSADAHAAAGPGAGMHDAVDAEQAAAMTNRSPQTIRRWCGQGGRWSAYATKHGTTWAIPRWAVEQEGSRDG